MNSADWELGWRTQQVGIRPECSSTQCPMISNPENIVVIKLFNNSTLTIGATTAAPCIHF